VYIPKDGDGINEVFRDLVDGAGKEKDRHNWQQPIEEARTLLRTFAKPGNLIVDPFAGGGGFGEAARLENMRFVGAEIIEQSDG